MYDESPTATNVRQITSKEYAMTGTCLEIPTTQLKEIPSALQKLDVELLRLDKSIEDMVRKLEPVMKLPSPEEKKSDSPFYETTMAQSVQTKIELVERLNTVILRVNRLLEL